MKYEFENSDWRDDFYLKNRQNTGLNGHNDWYVSAMDTPFGAFKTESLGLSDDIILSNHSMEMKADVAFKTQFEAVHKGIEMYFHLESNPVLMEWGNNADISLPMQHNMMYTSSGWNGVVKFEANKTYNNFDIYLPIDFLNRWLGQSRLIDEFIENIEKDRTCKLSPNPLPVTPGILMILGQINDCTYDGVLKKVFLEAKITELFALQLELCGNHTRQVRGKNYRLNTYDIEIIHEIGKYLQANADNPLSIVDLSTHFFINEHKLKNGFKEIFGQTIFDYSQQIRMEQAKRYLLDSDKSVKEIAVLSGYEYVSSFSSAFKRYFNSTPGQLRG